VRNERETMNSLLKRVCVSGIAVLVFALCLIFFSCLLEEESTEVYFKSVFLGDDAFQLTGTLYKRSTGERISGKKIQAKIVNYDDNIWNIEGAINDSQFTFNINKKDDKNVSLPFPDDGKYHYNTAWEYFTPYYSFFLPNSSERDKNMYRLHFYLDDYIDDKDLYEFIGKKPTLLVNEYIRYVYVPEPFQIIGRYQDRDGDYWSFDCNFEKPGWYKLFEFYEFPVNSKASYFSSKNVQFALDDFDYTKLYN